MASLWGRPLAPLPDKQKQTIIVPPITRLKPTSQTSPSFSTSASESSADLTFTCPRVASAAGETTAGSVPRTCGELNPVQAHLLRQMCPGPPPRSDRLPSDLVHMVLSMWEGSEWTDKKSLS